MDAATFKPLIRAFAIVVSLDEHARRGQLDEAGRAHLAAAERIIEGRSGATVLQAFRAWCGAGKPNIDPRGAPVRIAGEKSKLPEHRRGRFES